MMGKIFLIFKGLIIFYFLIGSIFCISEVAFSQPRIKFEEIYYDFDAIKTDKQVTHIFEVKNSGNKLLKGE